MTTSLYSLRSTPSPGEYTITKLNEDYEVESLYALNATTCTCPQGHKPKCKHRRMLPLFQAAGHVDDGWFLDWTTRLWHHPLADAPAPLADPALMGNAEHAEEIARRLAPALESEGSSLVPTHETLSIDLRYKTFSKDGVEIAVFESKLHDEVQRFFDKFGGAISQRDKASAQTKSEGRHDYIWRWECSLAEVTGEASQSATTTPTTPAPAPGEIKRRRF